MKARRVVAVSPAASASCSSVMPASTRAALYSVLFMC
ncbi:hypothetical protein SUBG_00075 [Sulfitobacter phage pCB2047-C]|nr:hypothetical protein SUBG_00075 [Sulfitobacter phage pCB2047-C]YP_009046891.1 hypothetical protein SUAG_00076 [Sulfitobacter phage pCB2047-A]AGG91196.2 hypothetical protein SUBG_00075 [Sulfitobacter phage pCB2047-C]AIE48236.1 hypothetical protein SUAG_00076 [Sulfitobacter phage pCB2047-A]